MTSEPGSTDELRTPCLVVDEGAFEHNVATMAAARPARSLRPHVKAFKSTALARRLVAAGHDTFCGATVREIEGMARAGLGADLLLANESLDVARLGVVAEETGAFVTVAVDSDAVLDAALAAGIRSVLVDIDVGLPRCGCDVETGARLADRARSAGVAVRGVMGYEGHLMMVTDAAEQSARVAESMAVLMDAAGRIGGDVVSGGGTGTYAVNTWCTEIQAGSYTLMDTQYATRPGQPFRQALGVLATVISVNPRGWIVADAGLKALGMDHGDPTWAGPGEVMFCSDEHITLRPDEPGVHCVGERVLLHPAHVDPTVAKHREMWLTDGNPTEGAQIVDRWAIDLRHW